MRSDVDGSPPSKSTGGGLATVVGVIHPVALSTQLADEVPDQVQADSETDVRSTMVDGYVSPFCDRATDYRFLNSPMMPDEIGRLGNYRVLKLLGSGGMAIVFLAEDMTLGRRVALKVMKPNQESDPSAAQRFLREARTLSSIKHDNVVTVFQVGQEERVIYLAMEWLQGQTLEDHVEKNGPPPVANILRIAREIATGLDVIHRNNLIHRDLKPSNLWVEEPHQRIKLLDFGLARPINDDAKFTMSGNIVGTPAFMSPEQARGERIDPRSDLFSLGGVLYHLCTGKLPFKAGTVMGMLTALAVNDPKPIAEFNSNVPGPLAGLIMQLLSKTVERRPSCAQEVIDRIRSIEDNLTATGICPVVKSSEADNSPIHVDGGERRRIPIRQLLFAVAIGLMAFFVCLQTGIMTPSGATSGPQAAAPPVASNDRDSSTPNKVLQPEIGAKLPKKEPDSNSNLPPKKVEVKPELKQPEVNPVYLSDLKPYLTREWLNRPPARPMMSQPDFPKGKKDFPPPTEFVGVRVNGKSSPHGIFMHPPLRAIGGSTALSYRLEKKYNVFRAEVSLNDGPQQSDSPLQFNIYGDDRLLWKSREVRSQADTQSIDISIKDVDVLLIEVNCPGEPRGAHAVWIEPIVSR